MLTKPQFDDGKRVQAGVLETEVRRDDVSLDLGGAGIKRAADRIAELSLVR